MRLKLGLVLSLPVLIGLLWVSTLKYYQGFELPYPHRYGGVCSFRSSYGSVSIHIITGEKAFYVYDSDFEIHFFKEYESIYRLRTHVFETIKGRTYLHQPRFNDFSFSASISYVWLFALSMLNVLAWIVWARRKYRKMRNQHR